MFKYECNQILAKPSVNQKLISTAALDYNSGA